MSAATVVILGEVASLLDTSCDLLNAVIADDGDIPLAIGACALVRQAGAMADAAAVAMGCAGVAEADQWLLPPLARAELGKLRAGALPSASEVKAPAACKPRMGTDEPTAAAVLLEIVASQLYSACGVLDFAIEHDANVYVILGARAMVMSVGGLADGAVSALGGCPIASPEDWGIAPAAAAALAKLKAGEP